MGYNKSSKLDLYSDQELIDIYNKEKLTLIPLARKIGCCSSKLSLRLKAMGLLKYRKRHKQVKDYTNRKFHHLVAIRHIGIIDGKRCWEFQCDCGKICIKPITYIIRNIYKSCGCRMSYTGHGNTWTGYEEISGRFWSIFKQGAKARNLEFKLTKEYMWDLYLKQNKKCALSNIDIVFRNHYKNIPYDTASIDRIDNLVPYIEGNVQWVHKHINLMKQNFNEEYFKYLCGLVATKYPITDISNIECLREDRKQIRNDKNHILKDIIDFKKNNV